MKNIFVGSRSFTAGEGVVRTMFEEYGSVERVSIVLDSNTGKPKGFGLVEMTNEAEAERAIAAPMALSLMDML